MILLLTLACAPEPPEPLDPTVFERPGPYPVGVVEREVNDGGRGVRFPLLIWYPAADAYDADFPAAELYSDPTERERVAAAMLAAPEGCPGDRSVAVLNAPAAAGPFPFALASPCTGCGRLGLLTVAEHLASHGWVVASPEPPDDGLIDTLDGTSAALTDELAEARGLDLAAARDLLIAEPPAPLRPGVYAALGHSLGAVAAGHLTANDPGVRAAVFFAAPPENPLLPVVDMADITQPTLFFIAEEDNSITELGNELMRTQHAEAVPPSWRVEVADAGHWSLSDVNGLDPRFMPGCGDDERQTNGEPFTYMDPALGRQTAAATALAMLHATVLEDPRGAEYLALGRPTELVTTEAR
ncbi:hypothetical protein L6R49_14505 [Myxococcota bacterium]|nr:hypothetical protein [Myxococcota bacterium]